MVHNRPCPCVRIVCSRRFVLLLPERLHFLSRYHQLSLGLERLILRQHLLALRPTHPPIPLPDHEPFHLRDDPLVSLCGPRSRPLLLLLYIKSALATPEHQLLLLLAQELCRLLLPMPKVPLPLLGHLLEEHLVNQVQAGHLIALLVL